jgi:anthranilate phosphoribosyltransferase
VRTIFNFLGPLTNPAGARRQLLGVSDRHYQETIAEALVGLGCDRALVVCSNDGVDEIGVHEETRVIEVKDGGTEEWFVRPEEHGLTRAPLESIAGGTPEQNAAVVRGIFDGAAGAARDVVILNAAGAILAAGIAADLDDGVGRAREAIDSGAAADQLSRLIETTRRLA